MTKGNNKKNKKKIDYTSDRMERASKALSKAHRDYEKKMSSYAFFKTSNRQTGQDLVQDTFTKTWKYLVKGGKVDLMKPFLYHVLNHLIIDEYRRRNQKTTSLDVLLEKGYDPSSDHSKRIPDILDGKEAMRLIKYLPEKYEKVIRMRYVQDLSIKEVSAITGQTRNAVAVQSHRGLAKLKKLHNNRT